MGGLRDLSDTSKTSVTGIGRHSRDSEHVSSDFETSHGTNVLKEQREERLQSGNASMIYARGNPSGANATRWAEKGNRSNIPAWLRESILLAKKRTNGSRVPETQGNVEFDQALKMVAGELTFAGRIPRVLWTYWDAGLDEAPRLVKNCIQSWKVLNPTWKVVFLSDDSATRLLSGWSADTFDKFKAIRPRAHKGDVIRATLMRNHGGVWADATTFCMWPLDRWLPQATEMSGMFAVRGGGPRSALCPGCAGTVDAEDDDERCSPPHEHDSWSRDSNVSMWPSTQFLAAEPGSYFFRAFYDRYVVAMLKNVQQISFDHDSVDYFFFHQTWTNLTREDAAARKIWVSVPMLSGSRTHAIREDSMGSGYNNQRVNAAACASISSESCSPYFKLSHHGTGNDTVFANGTIEKELFQRLSGSAGVC